MIRLLPRSRLAVAGLVLLCVLTASAYGAHRVLERGHHRNFPLYTFADNPEWFKAELDRVAVSGGTIRLPGGRIAPLELRDLTPNTPIRLVGRPKTVLTDLSIQGSRRIVVSGVRIRPVDRPAVVDVSDSRDVTFRNVRFLGVEEDIGVALQLDPDDRDITVADSEFARCQHGLACVLARGQGTDASTTCASTTCATPTSMRGAADNVVIRDSDLHDALTGTHSDNHNDLIQILGGGPWTIERNHFGVRANGAAQVYVDPRAGDAGPVHDVTVTSSVFTGSNKDMFFAINVRKPASSSVPLATRVASSTTRSCPRTSPRSCSPTSTRTSRSRQRPLVRNNILGRQKHALCDVARTFSNVDRERQRLPRRPHRQSAPGCRRASDGGLEGAARGRHAERRARDRPHGRQARRPPGHRRVRAALSVPGSPRPVAGTRDRLACCAMEISSGVRTLTLAETFTIARGTTVSEEVVWAEIRHGGHVGRGEGAPDDRYSESVEACRAFIDGAGDALGDDPFALEAIEARLRARGGSVVGCCAVECALHDLVGKLVGQPTWRLLGLADRTPETSYTIGIDSIEGTADRARRAAEAGYRRLKIKLGGEGDLERLHAIRAVCDLPLRVDANEGWNLDEARRLVPTLVELGVELIEQPFPDGERDAFRALRAPRAASRWSSTRAVTRCATWPTWRPTPTA